MVGLRSIDDPEYMETPPGSFKFTVVQVMTSRMSWSSRLWTDGFAADNWPSSSTHHLKLTSQPKMTPSQYTTAR